MSEDLKVDCIECKDIAFARNLAAQMREGYGRHNSNRSFQEQPRGRHVQTFRYAARPTAELRAPIFYIREASQVRVVGRFCDNAIMERWQDCRVGDAIANTADFEDYTQGQPFMRLISPTAPGFPVTMKEITQEYAEVEYWTFERVRVQMRDQSGRWSEQHFWKRLE